MHGTFLPALNLRWRESLLVLVRGGFPPLNQHGRRSDLGRLDLAAHQHRSTSMVNESFLQNILAERATYDSIAAATPLTLAPRLNEVLVSSEPPSVDFSQSLPEVQRKQWGVYALLLVKPDCPLGLYVGSGTDSNDGAIGRFQDYNQGSNIPRYVAQALNRGYTISHSGLLCWGALPPAGLFHRTRARFLAIEAVFTCLFHAAIESITDTYYLHLMP